MVINGLAPLRIFWLASSINSGREKVEDLSHEKLKVWTFELWLLSPVITKPPQIVVGIYQAIGPSRSTKMKKSYQAHFHTFPPALTNSPMYGAKNDPKWAAVELIPKTEFLISVGNISAVWRVRIA